MVRFLLASPACMILATAAAGAMTSLGLGQSVPPKLATAQFAVTSSGSQREANGRAEHETTPRVLHQASDGLFYTSALINGHPVRFIVDSGSSVVVLNDADAARAGVNDDGLARVAVQTAGGDTGMKLITLSHVTVAGQSIQHVDAAIVGTGLRTSLMGQSVLSRLRSVQFKNNELRFN
jgi:aspartyl protease family protein